jgi:hypothetical protein
VLLAEAASLAANAGIRVFCGGGDPATRAVPLGAILEALVSTDGPPVDPARLYELSQSPDQRFWLLRELQEALEIAASRAPLLVVVDDLQWADAASASAVVTLSRRLATHRIAVPWTSCPMASRGVPPALRVRLLSLQACGLDISGEADAAAQPVAEAITEAAASGDPAAEIVTFVPSALLAFTQGGWRGAIGLADEAARRQHQAKELRMWLPETWRSLLLISQLRLEEAHAIIEAGTREAENAAYKLYAGSGAVTGYHVFPDRGHSLVLDHGWREIADYTLSWLAGRDLRL